MPKETTKKTPAARKPTLRKKKIVAPSREQIEFRAYELSLEGHGDTMANWLRAERELLIV
jgi:hypothetical protein